MRLSQKSLFVGIVTSLLITSPPVLATADEYCFEEAGIMYQVSSDVLRAISKVESDHNSKAINHNKNGSFDFGHMGINSSWASILGMDLWLTLDNPCQNTKVGAWVLAQCIERHGYTWDAIGCYNATGKHKRIRYAWRVYSALQKTKKGS